MKQGSQNQEPAAVHLIGISGYARQILTALDLVRDEAGGRLASATVINRPEEEDTCAALEARGCRIFPDYQAMLASMPRGRNLCIVPTRIDLHAPMTIDALRAGADVLVEKPLAGSVEEGREMTREAIAAGRVLAVGYQDLSAPQTWEIKQSLVEGACGEIRSINVTASWPRDASYYQRNQWAGQEYCDGRPVFDSPLNNAFAHYLNLALFFAAKDRGDADEVLSVSGRLFRFFPIGTFDTAKVAFQTAAGVTISCLVTHAAAEIVEPSLHIQGTKGTLDWRKADRAVLRDQAGKIIQTWRIDSDETNRQRMLRDAIRNTHTGQEPAYRASQAIRQLEAIQKVAQELSIEDGPAVFGTGKQRSPWDLLPGLLLDLNHAFPPERRTNMPAA
jgi:predicted dehydrogenase